MNNGQFIFLSDEAKEKVSQMTDDEITILSKFLAYSMRESMVQLEDEVRCKAALQGKK